MANNLGSIKEVKKKANGEKVNIKECQITDPTGSVKIVLWASFADNIADGQTYKFSNLHLKPENGKASLGTTQTGCSIELCDPFPDLKPPKELPSTILKPSNLKFLVYLMLLCIMFVLTPLKMHLLSGEELEELLLSFDSLIVTYDYTNNNIVQIRA